MLANSGGAAVFSLPSCMGKLHAEPQAASHTGCFTCLQRDAVHSARYVVTTGLQEEQLPKLTFLQACHSALQVTPSAAQTESLAAHDKMSTASAVLQFIAGALLNNNDGRMPAGACADPSQAGVLQPWVLPRGR